MSHLAQYPISNTQYPPPFVASEYPRAMASAVRSSLRRFRLPLYSRCLARFEDLDDRVRILSLWHAVFDDPAPAHTSAFTLLQYFVWRVHEDLFRVDLTEMDACQNMIWSVDHDDPDWEPPQSVLDYPIPLLGYGIPWEMAGLDECPPCAAPLLAILDERLEDRAQSLGFDPTCFLESVEHWWAGRDRLGAAWGLEQQGVDGVRALQQALRLLPVPLDALADLVDCILRETNSVFINTVSGGYQCEYSEDFDIWDYELNWRPDVIRRYAESFNAVRPAIERMETYAAWYDETPDAEARVLAALERLVSGGWQIQDGRLIYPTDPQTAGAPHAAPPREKRNQ